MAEATLSASVGADAKACSLCAEVKPLTEFENDLRSGNHRRKCRICRAASRTSSEKHRYTGRRRAPRNKPAGETGSQRWRRCQYGMSHEMYEALLAKQGGACAICRRSAADGRSYRLYVDHDHSSGLIRGLLCHRCNTVIGFMGDDLASVRELFTHAITYLVKPPAQKFSQPVRRTKRMDVSTLKVADTAAIHVKNAAGEPLYDGDKPVRIVLFSPGSRAFAAIDSRQTARAVKRHNDNEGKLAATTAEERLQETAEDLAAVTAGFENLSYGDKTGADLFHAVYADPALGFITQQVVKALKDWSVFQGKSIAA